MSWKDKGTPFELTKRNWAAAKGDWSFTPSPDKITYNEGNVISSRDNSEIDLDGKTGVPITAHHEPCGYWWNAHVVSLGSAQGIVPGSRWIDMGVGVYQTVGDLAVYGGELYASGGSGSQNDTGMTFYKWYPTPGEFRLVADRHDENSGGRTYLAVLDGGVADGVYMVQDGGWWYAPDSYRWSSETGYTSYGAHNGTFDSILAIMDRYVVGGFGSSLRGTDGIKPFDVLINQNKGALYSLVEFDDYVYACSTEWNYSVPTSSLCGTLMRVSLNDILLKFAIPATTIEWEYCCDQLPIGTDPNKYSVVSSLTVYNGYIYGITTGFNTNYYGYDDYLVRWKPGMDAWEIVINGTITRNPGPAYRRAMIVFGGKLYSSGQQLRNGALYEFQDSTLTWKRVAPELAGRNITCLVEWNDQLYGGTYDGHLYMWDSLYLTRTQKTFID
jgi:hypothetical protein